MQGYIPTQGCDVLTQTVSPLCPLAHLISLIYYITVPLEM